MTNRADLHERVTEGYSRIRELVHTSLRPTFDLVEEVKPLARTNSGDLIWIRQQAAVLSARAALCRAPWIIQVVAQGRRWHRESKELMLMLAEVQCRSAQRRSGFNRP